MSSIVAHCNAIYYWNRFTHNIIWSSSTVRNYEYLRQICQIQRLTSSLVVVNHWTVVHSLSAYIHWKILSIQFCHSRKMKKTLKKNTKLNNKNTNSSWDLSLSTNPLLKFFLFIEYTTDVVNYMLRSTRKCHQDTKFGSHYLYKALTSHHVIFFFKYKQ